MPQRIPQSILYDVDDQMMGDTVWHLWVLTAIRNAYPDAKIFVPARWRQALSGKDGDAAVPSHSDLIFPQKELGLLKISTGEPVGIEDINQPITDQLISMIQNGSFDLVFSMHPPVANEGYRCGVPTFTRELGLQYLRPPETFGEFELPDETKSELIKRLNQNLGGLKHIVFQIIDDFNRFLSAEELSPLEYPNKIMRPHANPYTGWPVEFWGKGTAEGLKRRSIISIQTGTSEYEKIYPMAYFEELAFQLIEAGYSVVFIGRNGTDPRPSATFWERLKEKHSDHFRHVSDEVGDICFHQTKRIIAASQLHIAGDTGTAHLAAAMGKSVLALFGTFSQWQTAYPLKDLRGQAEIRIAQQGHVINPYWDDPSGPKIYNLFLSREAVRPNTDPRVLLETILQMGGPVLRENHLRKKTISYSAGIHTP